jgi:hypothetical protein
MGEWIYEKDIGIIISVTFVKDFFPRMSDNTRGLISLWLYEGNNKLRD